MSADQSSIEIKTALRKLNPKNGGDHKYRVRRLNKFRNYVTAEKIAHHGLQTNNNDSSKDGGGGGESQSHPLHSKTNTPEFYDDDLIMLFTGTNSMNGEDMGYSLLQAAGEPSTDHNSVLKRSAKNAMSLIKFLVCDFVDVENGKPVQLSNDLNGFAHAFCSLPPVQLEQCKLELHLLDNPNGDTKRSGSKQDACELVLMLIMHHTDSDGTDDEPISLEVLVPNAQSRNCFFSWVKDHKPANVMDKMKKRMALANDTQQMAALSSSHDDTNLDFHESEANTTNISSTPTASKLLNQNLFSSKSSSGPPVRWTDSQMAKFLSPSKKKEDNQNGESNDNNREQLQAAVEKNRAVEERQKHNGRDPLGLRGDEFDLQLVQANRETLIQEALELFQEEEEEELQYLKSSAQINVKDMNKESNSDDYHPKSSNENNNAMAQERLLSLHTRRDSFMNMIETSAERKQHNRSKNNAHGDEKKDYDEENGEDVEQENPTQNEGFGSILPFDPDFDPMLFLTLVHGRATYDQLQDALQKLNNTADNQNQRLQNIVRDNFALFVRCADGIDFFSDEAETASQYGDDYDDDGNSVVTKSITRALAPDQLNKLEGLADSCSFQAKKSFKPLLDNTNEVRKTQRALALLHRVSPLLQVPHQMRQHIEAGNYTQSIKAYRRILVIDKECEIDLLRFVKAKADEASRETRRIVERTVADATVSVNSLLEAIQDLGELEELNVSLSLQEGNGDEYGKRKKKFNLREEEHQEVEILRKYPPALACLQLQASHFTSIVEQIIEHSENITTRIYNGDSSALQEEYYLPSIASKSDQDTLISDFTSNTSDSRRKNKWRYDILEARVKATVQGVAIARKWLSRLTRIGVAAMDVERRYAARLGQRKVEKKEKNSLQPMDIFAAQVAPAINTLVSHIHFCSLGCSNTSKSTNPQVRMSFGEDAPQALQILLKTPLPPHESSRCALELADLVEIVRECANTAKTFDVLKGKGGKKQKNEERPPKSDPATNDPALIEKCVHGVEEALITMERRQCIYAFHVCTRNCGRRASGSGMFDGEALCTCVHALSKVLSRPEACTNEVEKGCHLVIMKCCEGLVEYVRDKQGSGAGTSSKVSFGGAGSSGAGVRLRAVSECSKMLSNGIQNVMREVSTLTNGHAETILEVMENEVLKLEEKLFQRFLEEVKKDVTSCIKLGYLDFAIANAVDEEAEDDVVFDQKPLYSGNSSFPGYLSASLLAIVRCRARVQKSIGETTIRRSQNVTYLQIAMSLASNTLIEALCKAIHDRSGRISGKQADMMANELQFLVNTLNKDLSEEVLQKAEECRRIMFSKTGRGKGMHGDGPDGLAAIEELERLGRVYVMCLGSEE